MSGKDLKSPLSLIKSELARRLQANPQYSQAAFARDLGLSRGELSEILRGKRDVSLKNFYKIDSKLGLSSYERNQILSHYSPRKQSSAMPDAPTLNLADQNYLETLSSPLSLALFALTDVQGFSWTPAWIAKRLNKKEFEIRIALERLQQLGILKKVGRAMVVEFSSLVSSEDISSLRIRELHRYYLDQAKAALDLQELSQRQVNGLSLAIELKDLGAIKKEISEFIDHLETKYSKRKKTKNALYHFESIFFRVDKD